MATPAALRVTEHLARSYRRAWRLSLITAFINPALYLLAMGVALGSLIGQRAELGGIRYIEFVAPALVAATAMQTAAAESSWPVMGGIKWTRTYHAMLATPVGVADVVGGHLAYIGFRLTMGATLFTAIIAAFGAVASPVAVFCTPAAVLTGLATAAPIMAFTATRDRDSGLANVMRFAIMPMFLFSGTFYPVSQLPGVMQPVARATPLWHGVELCRGFAQGRVGLMVAVHVAYLALWVAAGGWAAVTTMRRRMVV